MEKSPIRLIRAILVIPLFLLLLVYSCGQKNAVVRGSVSLSDGDAPEGTRISLLKTNLSTKTSADGRYSLTSVPPGDYTLVAEREGYQPFQMDVSVAAGVTLELGPIALIPESREKTGSDLEYGIVTGKVVLSDGKSPAGTVIVVADTRDSATVDPKGDFVLDPVPAGDHSLMAVKTGYRPADVAVSVLPGVTVTVGTFTLEPLETSRAPTGMEGTVKIAGNRPPAGVMVLVEGTSLMQITDGTGRFIFRDIDPGVYALSFQKIGYRENRLVGILVESGKMTSVETSLVFATFDGSAPEFLTEPGGLAGNVVTPIKEDLEGVLVWITPRGNSTLTKTDGTFAISGVRPGTYVVSAGREFYHRADVLGVAVRPGEITLVGNIAITPMGPEELLTEEPGSLSGIVLLEGELNSTGVSVALTNSQFSTITGFDGYFLFEKVPPGDYTLVATYNGFDPVEKSVQVPPNRDTILPPIELKRTVIAPKIVSVDPPDGAAKVPVDDFVQIVIQFDQRMNGRSLKGSFQIRPSVAYQSFFGNEGVADYSETRSIDHPQGMGVDAFSRSQPPPSGEDRLVVRLLRYGKPPVALNQNYTVVISKKAVNLKGVSIEEPYSFTFKTGGARITRTWPKQGAKNIVLLENDALLFDFNDRIDIETFKKAFHISPRPASEPEFFLQRVPSGDRVRVELQLTDKTAQEVTISRELRTRSSATVENTPFNLKFRSGSIDSLENATNLDEYFLEGQDISPARRKLLDEAKRKRGR